MLRMDDLGTLLDDVTREHAVGVTADGERLVALRVADEWSVGLRLHREGSHRQWSVRELVVRRGTGDRSFAGNDVRELPLGALVAEARRLATRSAGQDVEPLTTVQTLLQERSGRLGRDDLALAAVALEYTRIVERGERAPSKRMAEALGGSAGTWTNRVAEARRRGFLTDVPRGAAGGALTDQAREVLGLVRA
ncbi:hypothetical protein ASF38_11310 [Aeromicrobium sp. Leaf272]|nr:hypothetical protein ASF38_11310 [Aeromicrobium sp. Leaf272]